MKLPEVRHSFGMFSTSSLKKDLNRVFRRSRSQNGSAKKEQSSESTDGGAESNASGAVTSSSPVSKRRVFSGKWLPPPLRKLSQGKLNSGDGGGKNVPVLKKTSSDKKLKLPPTSPTAVTSGTSSDMGNRPSGQSEEEATPASLGAIRPSRSCSGEVGLSDHQHAGAVAAPPASTIPTTGEDAEDEVELPPPMKPISQQLLEATANAKSTEESQTKRSVSMPLGKGNEGSTTAELATELEQIVRERMEQHENVERLGELTLNDSSSNNGKGVSSPDFGAGPSSSSETFVKTGNGIVTSGDMMGTIGGGGEEGAGSAESPVDETALATKKRTYVIRELVETEQDYVRDLKETVNGYLAIMRDPNSEIPMPEDLRAGRDKIIFGNLEAIFEWHRDIFCKGLERCVDHPEELGMLFKKYERRLHMYVVYCQNKPMSEFIVSEHIDTYFEEIRLKLGHKLTLCDLLIKPVQRIMKYQLLLRDVLKYTERIGNKDEIELLKKACHVMHVVPKEANDMMNVGRLQGFDGKITAQGKLLLSGSVLASEGSSALNFKGKELQVFFFEQSIILSESVGKKTQFSNPVYIYKAHIQVNKMSLTESVDDGDPCKFILRSTDPKKPNLSFVCQTSSKESRDEWIGQLQLILQTQKDFLKAIQSPIKYQKNKLTKEVSSPDLLWSSSPPHHLEQSKTLITASTATVSVVPAPFVGCTAPLALDPSALAKMNSLGGSPLTTPANTAPPTPQLSRVSFSHELPSADLDCIDGGMGVPSSPTSEKDGLSSPMMIHPPHKHSSSPTSTPQTSKSSKKNVLNSWRTSLRSKGRSSSGRFATSVIPPITSCVIDEGAICDPEMLPKSPTSHTTDEDVQNTRNDNSHNNFEWNLGRRWSESVTSNPKLIFNFPNGTKNVSIPIPPTSLVKVLAEFQAVNADEVTVRKGESVQILGYDKEKNFYFVRKLIYPHDDGWIPSHILQNPLDPTPIKKPWSFRFKRPSFNKREKDQPPSPLLTPSSEQQPHNQKDDSIRGSPIIGLFGTGSVEDVMDLFDEAAPVFCHELKNVKCRSGETVILQCQLCMTPSNKFEPMVVFWKDAFGHVIRTGARHQVIFSEANGTCMLQIEECRLSDSGRYTCTASNESGSSTTSSTISVTPVPPAKPSAPTVSAVDTEYVELTWTPTSFTRSSIVKFYTVQHCIAESDMWTSCSVVAECKCRIHHLTPGQMYSFRIIAHGEGSTKSEPSPASESVIIPILSAITPNNSSGNIKNLDSTTELGNNSLNESSKSANSSKNGSMMDGTTMSPKKDLEFHKTYIELEDIDRGRFSIIRKCQKIDCGKELAVKFVHRKRWKKQLIVKEFQILMAISHPNVVRGYEFCETAMYTAIVMEHVSGIPLFSYLCEQDIYMEYTVAAFMHQLFQALEHIHGLEIAHLDIEPTNILIDKTVLPPVLKLVDFGDACYVAEGSPDCLPVTLPFFEFASPEVLLRQKCSVFSDMWSVGVLIYLILSGTFPFQSESFEKTSANIINCHYRFPPESFVGVSSEAKDLINLLLVADPGERWSASQCCQSAWIKLARKFVTPMSRSKLEPYIRGKAIENGLRRYKRSS